MKRRVREQGFTLIELLIVVAIIGILASMLIPNLLDAMDKAKQKRTMGDMRTVGTAMMAWMTDEAQAMAAGAATNDVTMGDYPLISREDLKGELAPQYLATIPERDAWKVAFEYRLDVDRASEQVMAIRSPSKDKVYSADVYTPGAFDPTDYSQDIVWTDGFFVRWPQQTKR